MPSSRLLCGPGEQDLHGATHVLDVPADTTVLDAAIDASVDVPYDCKMGVCL